MLCCLQVPMQKLVLNTAIRAMWILVSAGSWTARRITTSDLSEALMLVEHLEDTRTLEAAI